VRLNSPREPQSGGETVGQKRPRETKREEEGQIKQVCVERNGKLREKKKATTSRCNNA